MKNYSVKPEIDEKIKKELAAYPEILSKLLFYRGIKTVNEAEKFLHPIFEENHDPFLIHGMEKAIERILEAIEKKEKIIIFSDYDADGIPGAVILHDFFKKISENFSASGRPVVDWENYIPHRVLEGFGLNVDAIDEFAKNGAKLIITIDCGTANIKEAKHIKKHGIDLIIIDHHLPTLVDGKEILPEALAILNHKKSDSTYPEAILCASGLSYKLVQAFLKKYGEKFGINIGWEKWLLDMVAIATVSDMVPLVGENRIFAQYGLKVLQKSPRPGLQRLLSIIKVNQKTITEDDIGFMISPRINAASRMGKPEDAFNMLVEKNPDEAEKFAQHLNKINDERKGIVASMVKEIKKHWKQIDPEKKRKVLVAGNPDWKPSLLGLVASSLMDEHDGPVFLWGREEGKTLKGSVRSDGVVNIVEMMRDSAELLDEYGGHAMSGGFTVKFEKVDELLDALEASYKKIIGAGAKIKKELIADAVLKIDDVNYETEKQISQLAPFGMDNPKPVFVFPDIEIFEVKNFGKQKNHLKIDFKNSKGQTISAIGFFTVAEDFPAKLEKGSKITLFANLEKSYFLGREELRLRIVDMIQ